LVHAAVGKASFGGKRVFDNASSMLQAIVKAKPSTSKGIYLQKAWLALTMGPSVTVDLAPYR
ncbi:MAG: 50S ribosomal protein L1, partial [Proteobacteria bacterium]